MVAGESSNDLLIIENLNLTPKLSEAMRESLSVLVIFNHFGHGD